MNRLKFFVLAFAAIAMVACGGSTPAPDTGNTGKDTTSAQPDNTPPPPPPPKETGFSPSDNGDGTKSVVGTLAGAGETGQGPFIGITIKSGDQTMFFTADMGGPQQEEISKWEMDAINNNMATYGGKKIKVTYVANSLMRAKRVTPGAASGDNPDNFAFIEGTLKRVDGHGDGPGGFVLENEAGEEMYFEGDYQLEEDPAMQTHLNKLVTIYYTEESDNTFERFEYVD